MQMLLYSVWWKRYKQNPRVVVTILIANANNATMKHGNPSTLRKASDAAASSSHLSAFTGKVKFI